MPTLVRSWYTTYYLCLLSNSNENSSQHPILSLVNRMICASTRLVSCRLRCTKRSFRKFSTLSSTAQMQRPLLLGERRDGSGEPILTSSNAIAGSHVLYSWGNSRRTALLLHEESLDVSHRCWYIICWRPCLPNSSFNEARQLSSRYLKFDLEQLIKAAVTIVHARGARYCNHPFHHRHLLTSPLTGF